MRDVDYTYRRLGAKTPDGKIIECPRCGRRGAYAESKDGSYRSVTHEKQYRSGPFPHYHLEGEMFCTLPLARGDI